MRLYRDTANEKKNKETRKNNRLTHRIDANRFRLLLHFHLTSATSLRCALDDVRKVHTGMYYAFNFPIFSLSLSLSVIRINVKLSFDQENVISSIHMGSIFRSDVAREGEKMEFSPFGGF